MPFVFEKNSEIPDLVLIKPKIFEDQRGCFLELYKATEFRKNGIAEIFVQDNISITKRNVLRGIHFQCFPEAQGKLVSVLHGKVWDFAIDLRKESKTFLKWAAMELDETNRDMVYIPPGFGHAFVALSGNVIFSYKCTKEYNSALDTGIRWDDPALAIKWPIEKPIVSEKDMELPLLKNSAIADLRP